MGNICKGKKKSMRNSSVIDSHINFTTPSKLLEESKNREADSISRRSFERRSQKEITRSSILSIQNECLGAEIVERAKTAKEISQIEAALDQNFVLARLSDEGRQAVIEKMLLVTVSAGKVVFEANNAPTYLYIVNSGTLAELSRGEKVGEFRTGDSFGELALISRTHRKTTVRAVVKSKLWALSRELFNLALESVNKTAYEENFAFVSSVPLFEMLSKDDLDVLLSSMTELCYIAGQYIVKQGEEGDLFYVIKEGSVVCTEGTLDLRHMTKGEFFGEQALLYNSPRTATVKAIGPVVKCLVVSREVLMKAMGDQLSNVIYQNSIKVAFARSEVLSYMTEEQADVVSKLCTIQEFPKGAVVIPANTPVGSVIWIILKGSIVSDLLKAESLSTIGDTALTSEITGQSFPEHRAEGRENFIATISRRTIEEAVNCNLVSLITKNTAMTALRNVELLYSLSEAKFAALTSLLTIECFTKDAAIVQEATPADSFYIIKTGSAKVLVNGQVVRTMDALGYFGERAMLQQELRSATVVAQEDTECWVLTRDHFFSVVDDQIIKVLLKKISLQDERVRLEDLEMVRCLGGGMFGKVYLTLHKTKRVMYALKAVEKSRVICLNFWQSLLLEREVLLKLDHNFVMKLVKTMKDDKFDYFLMEYVPGLDFFDVLRQLGLVKEVDAQFYCGCLLMILEYLQEKQIVYRDLKPENIMIDEEGYPKLIDFGTAKIVEGRTFTILGTPHYMAPEVISGKGYSHAADLWSLGVILYEMVCGGVPYGESSSDPYIVYQKVVSDRLTYPSTLPMKFKGKPLIETLLNRNPAMRAGGRAQRVRSHAWFASVVWVKPKQEDLLMKRIQPPYLPKSSPWPKSKSSEFVRVEIEVSASQHDLQRHPLEVITQGASLIATEDWDHDF
jgi:cGMP-dependent protein kinase